MMKFRNFLIAALVILLPLVIGTYSQTKKSTSKSSNDTQTAEGAKAQDAVNAVLVESSKAFKDGLVAYVGGRRAEAGSKFNKSVEAFLYSTLNIQKDQRLATCFNSLVETVYRIEFPSETQMPQVKSLATTCHWNNIDSLLSESVAKINRSARTGFIGQAFEPSPLDELSKVELTPNELQIEYPVVQRQFQSVSSPAVNKSLGFSFEINPTIQQYVDYYRDSGRASMEVGLYRSGMFMRMARRIFSEERVPENIAWIGQTASEWKSNRQQGIWKLSPVLGKRFGLQQTEYVDEIKSLDEATRASARYLKFLADRYHGNWELAIAAYSSGEKAVDTATRESKVEDYWAIQQKLPIATRDFVADVLATIIIANSPNQYGFGHVQPAPSLAYDRIRLPASVDLSLIARASHTTIQNLRDLNPHLLSNITPPEPYVVNVPAGTANEIVALFKGTPTVSSSNNKNQELPASGETWQTLSNRTGVSAADLMAANPGMKEPKGEVFLPITRNNGNTVTYSRPTSVQSPAAGGVGVRIVKAKAGDTVARVAERYKADPILVAKYNGLLPNSILPAGREIKIPRK